MCPPLKQEYRQVDNYRYASPATVVTAEARQRDYRAAVTAMDVSIGRMLDLLDQKGVLDDTIVIFFSDNGGSGGADNSPLHGRKSTTWEGGVRVPFLIRWPGGGIEAGGVNDEFLTSLELFPSLAAATDTPLPEDLILDGFDWWPSLLDGVESPRDEMFWQRKDRIGVRVGKWKWVDMEGKEGGLFDLEADIGETADLTDQEPEAFEMVEERYRRWLQAMDETEPRGPFRDF